MAEVFAADQAGQTQGNAGVIVTVIGFTRHRGRCRQGLGRNIRGIRRAGAVAVVTCIGSRHGNTGCCHGFACSSIRVIEAGGSGKGKAITTDTVITECNTRRIRTVINLVRGSNGYRKAAWCDVGGRCLRSGNGIVSGLRPCQTDVRERHGFTVTHVTIVEIGIIGDSHIITRQRIVRHGHRGVGGLIIDFVLPCQAQGQHQGVDRGTARRIRQ